MSQILTPGMAWIRAETRVAREYNQIQIDALYSQVEQGLLVIAQNQKIGDPSQMAIREVFPATDFGTTGFTTEDYITASLTAGAWNTVLSGASGSGLLNNQVALGIFGLYVTDTNINVVGARFSLGATPKTLYRIDRVAQEQQQTVYFDPVFYLPGQQVKWELYARAAGTQRVGLIALIAEVKGTTFNGGLV